jgi:hypothetical protein
MCVFKQKTKNLIAQILIEKIKEESVVVVLHNFSI